MSLYRFYFEGCSNASDKIYISGKDYNHIKNVLRLRIGEEIIVSDGTSRDFHCRIAAYHDSSDGGNVHSDTCKSGKKTAVDNGEFEDYDGQVEAEIIDFNDNATELPVRVVLFQGMPKADKFEHIIQKTVELGVHEIYPVMMKRCVVKLEGGNGSVDKNGFLKVSSKEAKKLERYNKISEAAAKQSQRGIIPEVKGFISYKQAIDMASEMDMMLVPYESAEGMEHSRDIIYEIKKLAEKYKAENMADMPSVAVFIGPEGGYAPEEIEYAKEKGGEIVSLGNRILRTETAGPAIMSILGFMLDE
ncbi:MAG: 16S rRNA (uracil(1498)-N(3))-methyltransferase [Eubacterium sp.]|nr:16S rRNA (uracil(1498)-N(3))-methyltransferase [Eubacterium sp.]